MTQPSHGTNDRMSEEVYSDAYPFPIDAADQFSDMELTELLEKPRLSDFDTAGECDSYALIGKWWTSDVLFHVIHCSFRKPRSQCAVARIR